MSHDENKSTGSSKESWEQKTLEKVLLESVKEQRRKRRWGIFFKIIFLLIFFGIFYDFSADKPLPDGEKMRNHVGLVDLKGEIFDGSEAGSDSIVTSLTHAFKDPKTVAVILRIDSPGGSPVQADDTYNNIMRLRREYPNKPIYAVCRDICASAAYYIASATNQIYANPASIVGSIGVIMNGFGFVDTMQKLGVERRLVISGSEKAFLDPFSPSKPEDQAYAQKMLDLVHQQFIDAVKKGRGNRLKNDPMLFSGLAWSGEQAKDLGLVDGFGSAGYVARNVIHNEIIVNYTKRPSFFDQIARNMSSSFAHEIGAMAGLDRSRPLE